MSEELKELSEDYKLIKEIVIESAKNGSKKRILDTIVNNIFKHFSLTGIVLFEITPDSKEIDVVCVWDIIDRMYGEWKRQNIPSEKILERYKDFTDYEKDIILDELDIFENEDNSNKINFKTMYSHCNEIDEDSFIRMGFFRLDDYVWNEEEIDTLKIVSNIIVSIIIKIYNEEKINFGKKYKEFISNLYKDVNTSMQDEDSLELMAIRICERFDIDRLSIIKHVKNQKKIIPLLSMKKTEAGFTTAKTEVYNVLKIPHVLNYELNQKTFVVSDIDNLRQDISESFKERQKAFFESINIKSYVQVQVEDNKEEGHYILFMKEKSTDEFTKEKVELLEQCAHMINEVNLNTRIKLFEKYNIDDNDEEESDNSNEMQDRGYSSGLYNSLMLDYEKNKNVKITLSGICSYFKVDGIISIANESNSKYEEILNNWTVIDENSPLCDRDKLKNLVNSISDRSSKNIPMIVNSLAELEENERQIFNDEKFGSFIMLPISISGRFNGKCLVVKYISNKNWTDRDIDHWRAILRIFEAVQNQIITNEEQAKELLEQQFTNHIYSLVTEKHDMDSLTQQIFQELCQFLKLQRIAMYEIDESTSSKLVSVRECNLTQKASQIGMKMKEIELEKIPTLYSYLLEGKSHFCTNKNRLTTEERVYFEENSIIGYYAIPLFTFEKQVKVIIIKIFDDDDRILESEKLLCEKITFILENTIIRSNMEEKISRQRQAALLDVYKIMSEADSTEEMIQQILKSIKQITGIDNIIIYEKFDTKDSDDGMAYISYMDTDIEDQSFEQMNSHLVIEEIDKYSLDIKNINSDLDRKNSILKTISIDPEVPLIGDYEMVRIRSNNKTVGAMVIKTENEIKDIIEKEKEFFEISIHIIESMLERKTAEQEIYKKAYYDPLLDMPNRLSVELYLNECHKNNKEGWLVLVGVDNFKVINETSGHAVGDILLSEVAEFLETSIENKGRLFRFGGDEFLIVFEGLDKVDIDEFTLKILERSKLLWDLHEMQYYTTYSIGLMEFPKYGETSDEMLKSVDLALSEAKRQGKARIIKYSVDFAKLLQRDYDIEQAVRRSIENNFEGFSMHYQPVISTRTGKMDACEALLRFVDPVLGHLSPQEFIPMAEKTGLIIPIGNFVLHSCFDACSKWEKLGHHVRVGINVSVVQFEKSDLIEIIREELKITGCDPRLVTIEITESVSMHEAPKTMIMIEQLRSMGIKIALDDFGTGFFSFSTLQNISLDSIKIDKAFTNCIDSDNFCRSFVESIINLAHNNGKSVCVEGVETREQEMIIYELGADFLQGFFYSKPVPVEKHFQALMDTQRSWSTYDINLERAHFNTEYKNLKEQLRSIQYHIKAILRSSDDFVFEYTKEEGTIKIYSIPQRWINLKGKTCKVNMEEVYHESYFKSLIYEDDIENVKRVIDHAYDNAGDQMDLVCRFNAYGDEYIWSVARVMLSFDDEKNCYRFFAVCTSIDEATRNKLNI